MVKAKAERSEIAKKGRIIGTLLTSWTNLDGRWKEQGYFGAPETKVESFVSRCHVLRSVRVTEMTYLSSPVLKRKFGGVALL